MILLNKRKYRTGIYYERDVRNFVLQILSLKNISNTLLPSWVLPEFLLDSLEEIYDGASCAEALGR
jgi:hypothetical protein